MSPHKATVSRYPNEVSLSFLPSGGSQSPVQESGILGIGDGHKLSEQHCRSTFRQSD